MKKPPRGLVWHSKGSAPSKGKLLTNFRVRIAAEVSKDDGAETTRAFELTAVLNDGTTHSFTISAADFAGQPRNWVTEKVGSKAIIYPGMTEHFRCAIQELSDPKKQVVYKHLGWRKTSEGWMYLHARGCIGSSPSDGQVIVDVPEQLAAFQLAAPADNQQRIDAVRASLRILDLGPDTVMVPILCAVYRAVLGEADFSLHIEGQTGVFKSETAALAQQHWGAGLNSRNLPGAWSGTGNWLEALLFYGKDTLLVVDDFSPQHSKFEQVRLNSTADRVFRAQGNKSGRGRMRKDLSLQASKPPRALTLSTGEDVPEGQSLRARLLVIQLSKGDIASDRLAECQRDAAAGLYAKAMAAYVEWLVPRLDSVRHKLNILKDEYSKRVAGPHARTARIIADLASGFDIFLQFAMECEAIDGESAQRIRERVWTALGQVAEAQESQQKSQDPARRFLELISSAIASGQAHIANLEGEAPKVFYRATSLGWRQRWREVWLKSDSDEHIRQECEELIPQGKRIGWIDKNTIYLDPEASYQIAESMTPNRTLGVSQPVLNKRLHEAGLLKVTEKTSRGTYTTRKTIESRDRQSVLAISCSTIGIKPIIGPIIEDEQHDEATRPQEDVVKAANS